MTRCNWTRLAVGTVLTILFSASRQAFAGTVPLTTTEPLPVAFPLASGVPFPRGAVTDLSQLRLEDSGGREVPAQFRSLVQWPDGSQKSVLVVLLAGPSAQAPTYQLQYGPGVTRSSYNLGLRVDEDAVSITVTTGPARIRLRKSGFTVFDQAWADADGNGVFDATEQLLTGGGDLFLVNVANGFEYTASRCLGSQVSVEENGPVRAVVKATGCLQAPGGQQLGHYIVRLTALAGSPLIAADVTIVDPRPEQNVEAVRSTLAFSASAYGLRLPMSTSNGHAWFGGEDGHTYRNALTGPQSLFQHGQLHYVDGSMEGYTFAFDGVGTGARADGWLDVTDAGRGLTVCLKGFWQQFPKEFDADPAQLTVYFHPPRASAPTPDVSYPPQDAVSKEYRRPNTFYFPREGGAKTYRLLFQLHGPNADAAKPAELNALFQSGPRLTAPAAWYASSRAFGDLIEAGPWSAGYDDFLISGVYDRSVEQAKNTGGLTVQYGWRDYGDRMRPGYSFISPEGVKIPSFYNDTHVGARNFFIQYVRTLDPRWWEIGEIATRHWMDIDVSHTSRSGYWKKADGSYANFGPGEGHLIKHEVVDHDCRNLHPGHAHISGLPDYYLLTGDPRALEVLREVGDWWVNATPVLFPTPVESLHGAEAERDYGWPLFVMNEAYRATGDIRYLQAAAQVIRHLLGWMQTYSDHLVDGIVVGRNDWTQGTGWWYMYPKCDNCAGGYNGTNPWMAGALLASVSQFRELDQDAKLVDDASVMQMLLEGTQYVVKYGWETSRRYRDYDYFVYSEGAREVDGGNSLILYGLAYAAAQFDRSRSQLPTGWYDTSALWHTITRAAFDDWKQVKWRGSTALGFYGYEFINTPDFFAIMQRQMTSAPGNQPPTFPALPSLHGKEGQLLLASFSAVDPNGDALTYSATGLPTGASLDAATGAFSWTPTSGQAGTYMVTLAATDPGGLSASATVTIVIDAVNRPPMIDAIADVAVGVGNVLTITAHATDPNGDPLTYSADAAGPLPAGASLDASIGVMTWTPTADQVGTHTIAIAASDGQLTALASFVVTVTAANRPPVIVSPGDRTINASQLLTLTIDATDPDGDPVTLTVSPLPTGASFVDTTRTLSWRPVTGQAGVYPLTITASDGKLSTTASFRLTVLAVNRPPVINAIADATASEGRPLTIAISVSDPDGDPVTLSISTLPVGALFNAALRTLTWTPTFGQAGTYPITITASDGTASSMSSFTITVTHTNRPPVFAPLPAISIPATRAWSQTISANDPDGNPLTFSATGLPTGATFNATTRTLLWTPSATQAGAYDVSLAVSDGIATVASTLHITVTPTPPGVSLTSHVIVLPSGAPASGIRIDVLSNKNVIASRTTGTDGLVVFSGLTAGASYTVQPARTSAQQSFSPIWRKLKILPGQVTVADFRVTVKSVSAAGVR